MKGNWLPSNWRKFAAFSLALKLFFLTLDSEVPSDTMAIRCTAVLEPIVELIRVLHRKQHLAQSGK